MSTTLEAATAEFSIGIDDVPAAEAIGQGEDFAVVELTAEELEQVSGARNAASPKLL